MCSCVFSEGSSQEARREHFVSDARLGGGRLRRLVLDMQFRAGSVRGTRENHSQTQEAVYNSFTDVCVFSLMCVRASPHVRMRVCGGCCALVCVA